MVDKNEPNWMKYLMMYGWAVLLIFVSIGILWYLGVIAPESTNIVTCNSSSKFIEFYGTECPHCANMVPIIAQVENETRVTFERLEVWHNDTNQQLFQNFTIVVQHDCGSMGVPAFYSLQTYRFVCGEMSESSLKDFVKSNC